MVGGRRFHIVRMFPVFEEQLNIIQELGLVAFNGKMIMPVSFNDIMGDAALG